MGALAQRHVGAEEGDPDEQKLRHVHRPDQGMAEPAHDAGGEDEQHDGSEEKHRQEGFPLVKQGRHDGGPLMAEGDGRQR
ncbi:hypothetical protein D3C80_1922780 [compost metagenome]